MPAVTLKHREGCRLPHPGPGVWAWVRWTMATVRCEGTRPIRWLGIAPGHDDSNQTRNGREERP